MARASSRSPCPPAAWLVDRGGGHAPRRGAATAGPRPSPQAGLRRDVLRQGRLDPAEARLPRGVAEGPEPAVRGGPRRHLLDAGVLRRAPAGRQVVHRDRRVDRRHPEPGGLADLGGDRGDPAGPGGHPGRPPPDALGRARRGRRTPGRAGRARDRDVADRPPGRLPRPARDRGLRCAADRPRPHRGASRTARPAGAVGPVRAAPGPARLAADRRGAARPVLRHQVVGPLVRGGVRPALGGLGRDGPTPGRCAALGRGHPAARLGAGLRLARAGRRRHVRRELVPVVLLAGLLHAHAGPSGTRARA